MFSIRHPHSISPSFLSPHPPGRNHHPPPQPFSHPRLPARLQRNAPLAGLRSINRASTAPPNWFVISDPSLSLFLSLFLSLSISLSVDHGALLRCAPCLWTSAEVSKNIEAVDTDKERRERAGRIQTDG
ncbi:hypothetical protein L3Q82_019796 [Xyrichtys novacula]|uniref:Uncharacterized protein n=1 Tax=Xyrichtys novacula TaxID=13765 RepID=A0AAV1ETN6_XYRNO|nr:hypothetical protein L3Q82_019796 [Xyrichtys novacula]